MTTPRRAISYSEMVAELNAKHGSDPAEDEARRDKLRSTPSGRLLATVGELIVECVGPVIAKQAALERRIAELESQPRPKWCGAFKQGEVYHELAFVVHDGGLWVSKSSTMKRPGSDNSWQLCCKRGEHK